MKASRLKRRYNPCWTHFESRGYGLQHGSTEEPVELSVTSDGSTVVLSVRDEGLPSPPENLATIFDPLMRHTDPDLSAQRVPGSAGFGLYIMREIVVAHGGTVAGQTHTHPAVARTLVR